MPMSPTYALETWLDKFLSYQKLPQKKDFWLDTMSFLCERFNHPEKCAPCVHVAGSKGKGSVTEMLASIIEADGYKCGLYQSPHISDFRERVKLAHDFFPDEIYLDAANELINGIEQISESDLPNERPLTWFELVTLYAFLCFRLAKVDYAVYEVGLGGKLDATNVVDPELCLITQIEMEHTEFLGDTIEKIATEKAGIIKPNVPVIIGKQTDESVYGIVEKIAKEASARYEKVSDLATNIKNLPTSVSADNTTNAIKKYEKTDIKSRLFTRNISADLQLLGKVQAENAALAAAAAKKLIPRISESTVEKGLGEAFLPCRFEICEVSHAVGKPLPKPATLILDGAHTVTSIKNTIQTLYDFFPDEKYHLLFGCASDKDMEHIAPLLKNVFEKITITKPGESKKADTQKICDAFRKEKIDFITEEDTEKAFSSALKETADEKAVLLVAGSFYLAGAVKNFIKTSDKFLISM